jgi:DNA repair exonuclease SbcCD ATPase subunit
MEDLEKLSTDLAAQAAGIQVVDQASASRATEIILAGKALIKKITGYFEPIKKKARDSWQGLVDLEKAELSKVEPIVNALNQRVSNWRAEEDGKRRAAETAAHRAEEEKQRLEEEVLRKVREAEEQAEGERKRLEEEAEKLRQEAAEKADDAAALKRIEEEREKLRLQAAENQKRVEEATDMAIDEAAKAEAAMTPAPVVPEAPRTAGLSMRDNYSFEVTEKIALPEEFKIADQRALDAMARLKKDEFKILGGHVVNKPFMAEIGKRTKV